jgi:hypothetical protein
MAAGELTEVVGLLRDGGGSVALGALLVLAWRLVTRLISLMSKAETLMDAVIADAPKAAKHRERTELHFEAAESHLGALRKALGS